MVIAEPAEAKKLSRKECWKIVNEAFDDELFELPAPRLDFSPPRSLQAEAAPAPAPAPIPADSGAATPNPSP